MNVLERPLDVERTGLLVIDMQNAFCHPQGTLGMDGADVSPMANVIPKVKDLVLKCREVGIRDFWSLQQHLQDDRTRYERRLKVHTRKRFRPPALRGTWDAEVVDELQPLLTPETHLFVKHRFSCFFNTTLASLMSMYKLDTILVTGVATATCVESTVRDAYMRDLDAIVVSDCVASYSPQQHAASLHAIETYFGAVMSMDAIVAALGQKERP